MLMTYCLSADLGRSPSASLESDELSDGGETEAQAFEAQTEYMYTTRNATEWYDYLKLPGFKWG